MGTFQHDLGKRQVPMRFSVESLVRRTARVLSESGRKTCIKPAIASQTSGNRHVGDMGRRAKPASSHHIEENALSY